jgi:hypothetical protein
MSNHSGSYMLNEILHGLVEAGILKDISRPQKKCIGKLMWHTVFQYDCNWPEIIDVELAELLEICTCCAGDSEEVSAEYGYCARCEHETRQHQICVGEGDLLRQLLQDRFGSLPRWVSDKLQGAREPGLLRWGERLFDKTLPLEEILSSSGTPGG